MNDARDQGRVLTDEERARAMLDQLKSVHAFDVARDLIVALVNFSSPKLGLSDETRAVRDLGDVRLSIELIRAILAVVEHERGEKGTGDIHDTLAQLQLAYAHAVQLDRAEKAAEEEAGAGEPAPAEPAKAAKPEADPGEAAKPQEAPAGAEERTAAREPAAKKTTAGAKKKKPAPAKKPADGAKKPAAKKKPAGES